jgi:hypothetical protein
MQAVREAEERFEGEREGYQQHLQNIVEQLTVRAKFPI